MAAAAGSGAPDPTQVAQAFLSFFYQTFDSDRSKLGAVYQKSSMLTWEGNNCLGSDNIVRKLMELKFKKTSHVPRNTDVQPSGCGGLIIVVSGDLKLDDDQNPLKFVDVFHIMPTDKTMRGWWIHNHVFRLPIG